MAITFQTAQEQDAPQIVYLFNKAYDETTKRQWKSEPSILKNRTTNRDRVLASIQMPSSYYELIINDNRIIGFANMYLSGRTCFLHSVVIDGSVAGNGHGTALVRHCEEMAKKADSYYMSVEVLDKLPSLIKFYEKLGYKQVRKDLPFSILDRDYEKYKDLKFIELRKKL